ncbi:MAG TPA: NAD(P)-dependent oxidoreductase, partial [Anaerolineae bacterium]
MTKRVLVTGATGFIGWHCLPLLLEAGYEVHAASVDAPERDDDEHGIHWHRIDLLNAILTDELLARVQPSHLLHFAWYAAPGKYWSSPENLRWVQASLSLIQSFRLHGGRRVVMAGTCAEYDWNYGYCSEALTPLAPATLYGTSKHSLQLLLRAYAEQSDLSAAWGRIFFLYGPREHPSRLVASVIRSLLRRETADTSHGAQIRDFLHVQDVAGAFVALLSSEVTGAANIASGEPVRLKDIILRSADQLNGRELVRFGAIPTSPTEPPLLVANTRRLH